MRLFLRQMQPGQRFTLLRTGEKYTMIRRTVGTPGGTEYIVMRDGAQEQSKLHHSCHVLAERKR